MEQTYGNAKTYFQKKTKALEEVQRLMGDSAPNHGFQSAAAALERGLEGVMDKFNKNVEERIQLAVDAGLERVLAAQPPSNKANVVQEGTIARLKNKVKSLAKVVEALQKEVASLVASSKKDRSSRGGAGSGGGT